LLSEALRMFLPRGVTGKADERIRLGEIAVVLREHRTEQDPVAEPPEVFLLLVRLLRFVRRFGFLLGLLQLRLGLGELQIGLRLLDRELLRGLTIWGDEGRLARSRGTPRRQRGIVEAEQPGV